MAFLDVLGGTGPAVYAVVFAIVVGETSAFLGLLVPGEAVVLAAGALASQEQIEITVLIVVVFLGAVTGDRIGFVFGRRYGHSWLRRLAVRGSWGVRLARLRASMLGPRGNLAIVTGRFLGYVRPMVPFAAGAAGVPYRRFLAFSAPAALIWAVGSVLLGYLFGASGEQAVRTFGVGAFAAVAATVLLLLVSGRLRRRLFRRAEPGHTSTPTPSPSGRL